MFRFVHASDLHLGAAFGSAMGGFPEDAVKTMRQSPYRAFDRVIDAAIDSEAAFVVLAGDLCNRADGGIKPELALRTGARRLADAGIRTFAVYGNHDYLAPGRPDLDWPDRAHVFPVSEAEPVLVQIDGEDRAYLFGLSYGRADERTNLAARYPVPPAELFSVGILHAACGPVSGHATYAPCTPEDLASRGYDYWALGHVHSEQVLRDFEPMIAYAGNTQSLNPNETGPRGCRIVTVADDGSISAEFRETDVVRRFLVTVDIGPLQREQDLLDTLEQKMKESARDRGSAEACVLRFRLAGRGPLHRFLAQPDHVRDLREHLGEAGTSYTTPVWIEAIKVETRPDIDLDARRGAEDFLGEFLRLANAVASDPEGLANARKMLTDQMKPEHARLLAQLGPGLVSEDALHRYLQAAEVLGADHLLSADD